MHRPDFDPDSHWDNLGRRASSPDPRARRPAGVGRSMPKPRERPRHGGFRRATTRRWSRLGAGVAGLTPLAPPGSVDRACVSAGSALVAGLAGLSLCNFATISFLPLALAHPAF